MAENYKQLNHSAEEIDEAILSEKTHVNDNVSHITSTEREKWNNGVATSKNLKTQVDDCEAQMDLLNQRLETMTSISNITITEDEKLTFYVNVENRIMDSGTTTGPASHYGFSSPITVSKVTDGSLLFHIPEGVIVQAWYYSGTGIGTKVAGPYNVSDGVYTMQTTSTTAQYVRFNMWNTDTSVTMTNAIAESCYTWSNPETIEAITNNAEVIDIRVGADGKTYTTAGEAVRTQLSRTYSKETATPAYMLGGYVASWNGTIKPLAGVYVTDYIPVRIGDRVTCTVDPIAIYAVYDKDLNYLYGLQDTQDKVNTTQTYLINNPNARYIRLSQSSTSKPITVDRVSVIDNEYETVTISRDDLTGFFANKFINPHNGRCTKGDTYYATDFIECDNVALIELYNYQSNANGAFYDENLNYVGPIRLADKDASAYSLVEQFTVPKNAKYMRITLEKADAATSTTKCVYYKRKTKEAVKPLEGKNYLSVGDSITWYDRKSYIDSTTLSGIECIGYQSYIILKLGCNHENCGYSGKTSEYMREQVLTKDFTEIDIVSIMTGMNDWAYSVTTEDYKQNIRDMIDHILTNNPLCKIVLLSPTFGYFSSQELQYSPRTYTEAMKEVALEYGLPFFDNMGNNGINKHNVLKYMADNRETTGNSIHPNIKGYNIIGNQLVEFFKQFIV